MKLSNEQKMELERAKFALLNAQNREDVRKAENLRKTAHLRAHLRGRGKGPAVAR